MSVPLVLAFKGSRSYLRGSDIYQALAQWCLVEFGSNAYVNRLSFRRLAKNVCYVVRQPPNSDSLVGEGAILIADNQHFFWLMESKEPVIERYAFDEEQIVATSSMDIEKRTIRLSTVSDYELSEVVALTKQLNYAISPEVAGNWLFGQLQLEMPLQRAGRPLRIVMRSLLANRFSVNDIYYGDQRVGNIRFIVGKP
ncbi:hypothetical protein SAMN05216600_102115 [Pseudomonas cuatrocienegasensis]|uniref:Uncharacterized protein n=1 Tax=Pseudomonas cuatrocienegasensis TaxID=543360 RepID=A0ABY1B401_9PSED|nr:MULTISPECIES: hypothetical protein [Pseudomonas]OEC37157.1 hypothetical protein A7D25_00360 [Pseudomonas sp. 21C1]SEP87403.1 hypothetical protein SAMN05216600_102115 [Pseudomonas cuatrocienegasensis]